MKTGKLILIRKSLTVLYLLLIVYLSSQPALPKVSDFQYMDKILHCLEYFFLALFIYFGWGFQQSVRYKAFIFMTFFAASDELHQLFVPNRVCSFADFIADNIGITLGFILMKVKTSAEFSWYNFLLGKKK